MAMGESNKRGSDSLNYKAEPDMEDALVIKRLKESYEVPIVSYERYITLVNTEAGIPNNMKFESVNRIGSFLPETALSIDFSQFIK